MNNSALLKEKGNRFIRHVQMHYEKSVWRFRANDRSNLVRQLMVSRAMTMFQIAGAPLDVTQYDIYGLPVNAPDPYEKMRNRNKETRKRIRHRKTLNLLLPPDDIKKIKHAAQLLNISASEFIRLIAIPASTKILDGTVEKTSNF